MKTKRRKLLIEMQKYHRNFKFTSTIKIRVLRISSTVTYNIEAKYIKLEVIRGSEVHGGHKLATRSCGRNFGKLKKYQNNQAEQTRTKVALEIWEI